MDPTLYSSCYSSALEKLPRLILNTSTSWELFLTEKRREEKSEMEQALMSCCLCYMFCSAFVHWCVCLIKTLKYLIWKCTFFAEALYLFMARGNLISWIPPITVSSDPTLQQNEHTNQTTGSSQKPQFSVHITCLDIENTLNGKLLIRKGNSASNFSVQCIWATISFPPSNKKYSCLQCSSKQTLRF